jgi:type IV secretory pathway protease TraF
MKPRASDDIHTHGARERRTASPGGDTSAHGARRTRRRLVLGGLVLAAVLSTRWVRLNLSPSVPRGVYRLAAVSPPLARGTLVVLPVPAAVRPWQSAWVPLLKPVAAVAGEVVCSGDDGLWVGRTWYGPLLAEAGGRALPRLRGCVQVRPGQVFVASPTPRSLDGRYFGVTAVATLTAQAVPVWTWR